VTFLTNCSSKAKQNISEYGWPWHWNESTIVTEIPERPAGQKNVLKLRLPKMDTVRVAFVGLGMRGPSAVHRWTYLKGVKIQALCDYEEERANKCQQILIDANLPKASIYSGEKGYIQLCKRNDIDLVYIATDWKHHFPIAKCALENGKNVAIEVPSAMNLTQIWELINLSEKNRLHCMLLENCCYDDFELTTLNMAQHGLFGEILHVEGAYIHNLDQYWDSYWHNWRLDYNQAHRGDIYATHGLGPIAQVLNIHRGDRMKTLVAMDTKAVKGPKLVEAKTGKPCEKFLNGEHTTTLIRTENAKVIEIQHDVMDPQPYSRRYQLTGTKGFANKYPVEGYVIEKENLKTESKDIPEVDNLSGHEFMSEEVCAKLISKYEHPIIQEVGKEAKKVGGHGGMDFVMDYRLVYCLHNGLPLDIDVYDLAEWCCLAELGSLSMNNGNAPVEVPDFTRGHWNDINGYSHAYIHQGEKK